MALNEFNQRNSRTPTPQRTIDESIQQNSNTLNSLSLQYQEINYPEQAKNQRLLNTMENQDHLVIRALYRKDLPINLGTPNGTNIVADKFNMKIIGSSYDRGYSMARAKHELLKAMVGKE